MISIHRRSAGFVTFAFVGIALIACSAGGEGTGSTSSAFSGFGQGGGFDPLLMGSDGGFGGACATCIESSCSSQLSALEGELKALHSATHAAFGCVQANKCLSLFWEAGDGGKAAAKEAVLACIAACDAEAGLPDIDAAEGDLAGLTEALQSCVESSCAASCPFANQDGGVKPPPPTNDDGGTVSEDASAGSDDASAGSEDSGAGSEDAGQVSEDAGSGSGFGGGWGGGGLSGVGSGCH
jgi:hypothetical protein